MFSFQEVSELMESNEGNIAFVCGQPLDIYPNLEVTNCFPLSKFYKVSINDFNNIKELYEHLEDEFMTPEGAYTEKCTKCYYFGYACSGGCKAFYMNDLRERRLQNEAN
jgi:radical SAM protein with 4Fe4S-binding SPASM domain